MIQNLTLKAIVFFIPTQLGLHFWPDFSRVMGIRLDYLSPTLYFVDCLIIVYLLLNLSTIILKIKKFNKFHLFVTSTLSLTNLFFSLNPLNSLFQYLKLAEYFLFYLVISSIPNLWSKIRISFISTLCLVIFVQFTQMLTQHSLNGVFYYLGERSFSSSTPNLPLLTFGNLLVIRVMSLFSHPNSLAGFLLLSLLVLNKFKENKKTTILTTLSVISTFSKAAYLALLGLIIKMNLGSKLIMVFVLLSLAQLTIPALNLGIYSFDSRVAMLNNFQTLVSQYLVVGAGLGNYVIALSKIIPGSQLTVVTLQPVHNLFFLSLIELGLPMTLLIVWGFYKSFSKKYYLILLAVLITGLFDHYWFTLPQNKLILVLALALFK